MRELTMARAILGLSLAVLAMFAMSWEGLGGPEILLGLVILLGAFAVLDEGGHDDRRGL